MLQEIHNPETQEYDLPEVLAAILLSDDDDLPGLTVDDFLEFTGIPPEYRNDFSVNVLTAQAEFLLLNAG